MAEISLKCTGCGAENKVNYAGGQHHCEYCGSLLSLPRASTGATAGSVTVTSESGNIVRRGYLLLETGSFDEAKRMFQRALDTENPEDSAAYWGALLAGRRCRNDEELCRSSSRLSNENNYQMAVRFANDTDRMVYTQIHDTVEENYKKRSKVDTEIFTAMVERRKREERRNRRIIFLVVGAIVGFYIFVACVNSL